MQTVHVFVDGFEVKVATGNGLITTKNAHEEPIAVKLTKDKSSVKIIIKIYLLRDCMHGVKFANL